MVAVEPSVEPPGLRPQGRAPRGNGTVFVVAASALVVVALAASISTGSWWIPHNDDWAFTRIAERFARTGDTSLIGWNNMSVAGQVFVLGPLGTNALARHLFVLAGALLFAACCYWAVRDRHGLWWAGFSCFVVVVSGPFLLLSTSFMTDLPAAGLMLLSFMLGRRSVQRRSAALLAASIMVGLWAATIRDTAIVAPVVVLAEHMRIRLRGSVEASARLPWPLLGAGWVALAGGFLAFEVWRRSLPNGMNPEIHANLSEGAFEVVALFFTVSTLVFPAVLVRSWRPWSLKAVTAGAATFAVGAVAESYGPGLLTGNYVSARGSYWGAGPGNRTLWFSAFPASLELLALGAGILCAAALADSGVLGKLDTMWTLYILGVTSALVAPALLGQGLLDRYVLPLVVPVLVLILPLPGEERDTSTSSTPLRRALAAGSWVVAVMVSTALSMSFTLNALAYDAARWHAAEDITRSDASPTDIVAGLEWIGYHANGPAHAEREGHDRWFWATPMFDGARSCYVVSASPIEGAELMGTSTYRTYAWLGRSTLYAYTTGECQDTSAP